MVQFMCHLAFAMNTAACSWIIWLFNIFEPGKLEEVYILSVHITVLIGYAQTFSVYPEQMYRMFIPTVSQSSDSCC